MPNFSNQSLDDSNVDLCVGALGDIKLDMETGKIFGKLYFSSINNFRSPLWCPSGFSINQSEFNFYITNTILSLTFIWQCPRSPTQLVLSRL